MICIFLMWLPQTCKRFPVSTVVVNLFKYRTLCIRKMCILYIILAGAHKKSMAPVTSHSGCYKGYWSGKSVYY